MPKVPYRSSKQADDFWQTAAQNNLFAAAASVAPGSEMRQNHYLSPYSAEHKQKAYCAEARYVPHHVAVGRSAPK